MGTPLYCFDFRSRREGAISERASVTGMAISIQTEVESHYQKMGALSKADSSSHMAKLTVVKIWCHHEIGTIYKRVRSYLTSQPIFALKLEICRSMCPDGKVRFEELNFSTLRIGSAQVRRGNFSS
jgi:hypothetical protein